MQASGSGGTTPPSPSRRRRRMVDAVARRMPILRAISEAETPGLPANIPMAVSHTV